MFTFNNVNLRIPRLIVNGLVMFHIVGKVLVLIAFLGLTTTATTSMSCSTAIDHHNEELSETLKSDHAIAAEDIYDEKCCEIDCCDTLCICVANSCASFIYLQSTIGLVNASKLKEALYVQNFTLTPSIVTLLYRPPILVS